MGHRGTLNCDFLWVRNDQVGNSENFDRAGSSNLADHATKDKSMYEVDTSSEKLTAC